MAELIMDQWQGEGKLWLGETVFAKIAEEREERKPSWIHHFP